jgi:quercetin dioxygenase-like cupin family protein
MQTTLHTLQPRVIPSRHGRTLNVLGHAVSIKLDRQVTAGHYYVFEVVTPPGHGIPPHVHEHEDEMIYVVEGEFAIALGQERFQATPGAEIFFPRRIVHAFHNSGTGPGRTLWTVVPGGNFEEFFERLGALPPGEPDPQTVIRIFADYGMRIVAREP